MSPLNVTMSNVPMSITDVNNQLSQYPHWSLMLTGLTFDIISVPFCPGWRELVNGLADDGMPFSKDYRLDEILSIFPTYPSFADFRTEAPESQDWLTSLYNYCFRTDSTALSCLFTPTALVALAVLFLLLRSVKSIAMPRFRKLGEEQALQTKGEEWVVNNQEKLFKVGEYGFRLCYHFFICVAAVICFADMPWWDSAQGGKRNVWRDYPEQKVEPALTWYYLLQGAYNVDAFVTLVEISFVVEWPKHRNFPTIGWSKHKRGDFNEMFFHHILTNLLVFLSSLFRMTRIGAMIFFMHDISDIPVDLSKLAHFLRWEKTTVCMFSILVGTWIVARLYILPGILFQACYPESRDYDSVHYKYIHAFRPFFFGLNSLLISLHWFWFSMFIKMAHELITTGRRRDISVGEDSSATEDDAKSEDSLVRDDSEKSRNPIVSDDSVKSKNIMGDFLTLLNIVVYSMIARFSMFIKMECGVITKEDIFGGDGDVKSASLMEAFLKFMNLASSFIPKGTKRKEAEHDVNRRRDCN